MSIPGSAADAGVHERLRGSRARQNSLVACPRRALEGVRVTTELSAAAEATKMPSDVGPRPKKLACPIIQPPEAFHFVQEQN